MTLDIFTKEAILFILEDVIQLFGYLFQLVILTSPSLNIDESTGILGFAMADRTSLSGEPAAYIRG